jgi:hypothetical protein
MILTRHLLKLCLHRIHQAILCYLLHFERFHYLLIYGALRDDVKDHNRPAYLSLPPQSGIGLNVEFQAPRQTKPNEGAASGLQIQSMAGTRGMNQPDRDLLRVPFLYAVLVINSGVFYPNAPQSLRNTFKIMLVPVRDKNRFSLLGFDDVLKGVELVIVDNFSGAFIRINGAIRHLGELPT